MSQLNRIMLFILILTSIVSCKNNIKIKKMSQLNINYEVSNQIYNINSQSDTILITKQLIKFHIPKYSFATNSGDSLLHDVRVEIQEFLNISDIIANNLVTRTIDGRIIETGGMVRINVYSNSQPLRLQKLITIEFPNKYDNKERMYTFYGDTVLGEARWEFGDSTNIGLLTRPTGGVDTVIKVDDSIVKYLIQTNKLGLINCDRFLEFDKKEDFIVEINSKFKDEVEIGCYLVFKNYKSVLSANSMNGKKITFASIPSNEQVSIVCIGKKLNEYLYGTIEVNSSDKEKKVTLNIIQKENIGAELKKLDNIWM